MRALLKQFRTLFHKNTGWLVMFVLYHLQKACARYGVRLGELILGTGPFGSRLGHSALHLIMRRSIATKGALQRGNYGSVVGVMSHGSGAVLMLAAWSALLIYHQ